jgi:diguanylate cyclase (GGDEF)-like protein/PAS domain S-box-containing protein
VERNPVSIAPELPNEGERLAALARYNLLDTPRDPAFDAFTRLASEICGTPVSTVTLIDETRQWFKSAIGLGDQREGPREHAFCTYAMGSGGYFEVEDARSDPRFAANPLVTGQPHIRFYAGVPLVDTDGFALGTLCAFDSRPRTLSTEQRYGLQRLATSLVRLIESRKDVPSVSLDRQTMFNAAFEFSADPIAILRVDPARSLPLVSYVNRAFAELFEHEPTALIGDTMRDLYGPKTDPRKLARLLDAARRDESGTETTYLYSRTGTPRLVEIRERVVEPGFRVMSARDLSRVEFSQEVLSDTNARLRSLIAHNSDAVLTFDREGACVDVNPAACAVLDFTRDELLGFGFSRAVLGSLFPLGEFFPDALGRGETMAFPAAFLARDGRPIDFECKAIPMVVRGTTEGAYVILKDVTQAKELARTLEDQAARTRSLYLIAAGSGESASEQIDLALQLVLDAFHMDYAFVGRLAAGDVFAMENVVGTGVRDLGEIIPLDQTIVAQAFAHGDVLTIDDISSPDQARETVKAYAGFHGYIAAPLTIEGENYGAVGFMSKRIVPFNEQDRDFVRLVSRLIATTIERDLRKQRLHELAYYDMLTGLPNRAKLMDDLSSAAERALADGGGFALHFIDLDGFKAVNDFAGHASGDEVLVECANRLRALRRTDDLPARFGGDEFVLLQAEVSTIGEARALGERIVAMLSEPYETRAGALPISASVGFALFPADGDDSVERLLQRADAALYRAKALGKCRVEFLGDPVDSAGG